MSQHLLFRVTTITLFIFVLRKEAKHAAFDLISDLTPLPIARDRRYEDFASSYPDPPDSTVSWCPSVLTKLGAMSLSSGNIWNKLNRQILNATYFNLPTYESLDSTVMQQYEQWVDTLYSFYTVSRLRRSVMNPAPPKEIVQILKLAAEIKLHNSLASDEKDKRSLRILLLGGSVTIGTTCSWPEGLGIPKLRHWSAAGERCAWSFVLEKILDSVIFEGQKVVKIENIATGGQSSETGTMVLEYELFLNPEKAPDVVISAFSANEAQEPQTDVIFYDFMQNFVKAAQRLQPCNNHAPLVMMVDDFYAVRNKPHLALEQSARVS
mmetsp:Transcript_15778/g.45456  ORF Transcript_15778/g.45456 Transcript_15778/m.45456 type:complete len:323 (-) Transcript_15778:1698-2666(-)